MEGEVGYIRKNMSLEQKDNASESKRVKELAILMHVPPTVPHAALKMDLNLEDALDIAGAGKYQLFHWTVMLLMIFAAMLEMIGIAFVLPAATCDLNVPDSLRGIITSIPNIGVIMTAPFWGRAADHYGRKPVLLVSATASGLLALLSALMPDLVSFAVCKLVASMFLSCPSSLTIAYACEMMPRRHRDRTVLLCNGLLMILSTFNPVLAWAVLSWEWRWSVGSLVLRPWRLLTALYAVPLLLTALALTLAEESPKFLITKGRDQDALDVLRRVFVWNGGREDSFGVKSLSISQSMEGRGESAWALLRAPHLKWLALTGFLMFGLFSLLNGLFLLAPDTINKVMSGADGEGTICALINQAEDNSTILSPCTDTISHSTFYIMMVTTLVYGVIVTGVSITPLSMKTQLVSMYACVSAVILIAAFTTHRVVAGVAMSALQMSALGIGPLTAYAVQLFPTTLRGTAVGAVMMFGRVGSAAGANTAGYFLAEACGPTFYGFTVLTLLCAALSFLLPGTHNTTLEGGR